MGNKPIYYLNWKKVSKLDMDERTAVHNYYRDMLLYMNNGQPDGAKSIYLTLSSAGLMKDSSMEQRDSKINIIIDEKI